MGQDGLGNMERPCLMKKTDFYLRMCPSFYVLGCLLKSQRHRAGPYKVILLIAFYLFWMNVYMCADATIHVWGSEDNFQ